LWVGDRRYRKPYKYPNSAFQLMENFPLLCLSAFMWFDLNITGLSHWNKNKIIKAMQSWFWHSSTSWESQKEFNNTDTQGFDECNSDAKQMDSVNWKWHQTNKVHASCMRSKNRDWCWAFEEQGRDLWGHLHKHNLSGIFTSDNSFTNCSSIQREIYQWLWMKCSDCNYPVSESTLNDLPTGNVIWKPRAISKYHWVSIWEEGRKEKLQKDFQVKHYHF